MGHPLCSSESLNKILESVCGGKKNKSIDSKYVTDQNEKKEITGKVVLMKKNVLDITDQGASFLDWVYELFGKGITIQLISSVHRDPERGLKGKLGKATALKWSSIPTTVTASEVEFDMSLEWDESIGVPGAFIIKNNHHSEFYLKTVTLEDVPDVNSNLKVKVHFICNSWVYPAHRYKYDRVFFSNETYLPHNTPKALQSYREEELVNLRGNGSGSGELKEWDRVYDYAYYNDLGSPKKRDDDHARPVLGGTKDFPYPRRGKTGRAPNKTDPKTESRLPLLSLNIYVPRDERFNQVKFSDFLAYSAKSIVQVAVAGVTAVFDKTPTEFDKLDDVLKLYKDKDDHSSELKVRKCVPWEFIQELGRSDSEKHLRNFPVPDVIKENRTAWRTDEEFAREMLAGVNPVSITRLKEFPPKSKLDPEVYGNQTSTITREQIEMNMNGLTVKEAIESERMFILDHHDALMPYLRRINSTNSQIYATRTVLILQDDGTLKPLAIELSLPHSQGDTHGATSSVFTPAHEGIEGNVWQLAKAYAAVNDSGYHQLVSHWLNTHAVIEPFIIATNRQLSVLHPIYKLLHPHFKDTMNINALARQILINAGGVLEMTVFPAKYSMEMSSAIYRDWVFTEHSLPADLLKRGVAVEDLSQPNGVRLLIDDYPYAVDGLEIWSAIETWVHDYCCLYYQTDDLIQSDIELQSWWTELREEGHGDLKDKPWWPTMQTKEELIHACTIIIWVASALHAAVNFGQYSYAGYLPNRPTVSRQFMPQPGTKEYTELEKDFDKAFLKTITAQFQTLLGVSLIEILSRHASDEIYLGQRETKDWTTDSMVLEAFDRFGSNLKKIEERIDKRNDNEKLKNRVGQVKVPYTLLYPNTSGDSKVDKNKGLSGRGIPNSVSI